MKIKQKQAIHAMTDSELKKHIAELKQKLAQVTLSRKTKQLKNVRETRTLRQHIAVCLTVVRKREMSHEKNA